MKQPAYTITDTSIVISLYGKVYTVNCNDDRFDEVDQAIIAKDFDAIPDILDVKGKLISASNGGLYLLNGILRCDSYEIPALLATRIRELLNRGHDINPLSMFLENLMQNPNESGTIVEEIYGFIEACELPITADGHFLAYKMVRNDFMDIYSGSMDNSVGQIVEMDRAQCDFNRNQTCSSGLHFCSEGYLGCYGHRGNSQVVVVKVNPRDVTSIPTDYDNAKGRACKYEIVDALPWDEKIEPLFTEDYSEPEPEVKDEIDFDTSDFRWEVRKTDTDELVDRFVTRQGARDYRRGSHLLFIWDAVNEEVVAGGRFATGALEDEPEDDPDLNYGEANPSAKLDDSTVRQIRKILEQGAYDSIMSLAQMFGVSDRTIRRIRDWESWKHVTTD